MQIPQFLIPLQRSAKRQLLSLVHVALVLCLVVPLSGEQLDRTFAIKEGKAIKTLKRAARQGEVDIVFSSKLVRGIVTKAVRGRYTAGEALALLLEPTPLQAVEDTESGAFVIIRARDRESSRIPENPESRTNETQMNTRTPIGKIFRGILGSAVIAGSAANGQDDLEDDDIFILEAVTVTTGSTAERTVFETPQSVSMRSELQLRTVSSSSQGDILGTLPGIKAEGGGGEVATNVFVRGLPSGGQYAFTPLEYDGIPVYSTFGLNSSAFDVYYRNDLGIERLEYVTGGASNLFGPGSVAGIINYVSKTGSQYSEGAYQLEIAEDGRVKADLFHSGPLGGEDSRTYYAVSGYYRTDEGPLESGLDTDGFQLRGNIKHEFANDSGSLTVFGQYIDDKVQFFLPLPLDANSRERLTGNDGGEVFTANTAEAANLSYAMPGGSTFRTPIEDGVATKGGSVSFIFDKKLGNDWNLNIKGKAADYDHDFNLFLDGDGVINVPESQTEFLANRGYGDGSNATFSFTNGGGTLPNDFLLFGNRLLDRQRDTTDMTGEVNLSRKFDSGETKHTLTMGAFFSDAQANDYNVITTYLGDFRNQPKLVDVVITDVMEDANGDLVAAPGETFRVTQNGLLNANGITGDRVRSAARQAFYIADQIEMDNNWSFDVGFRYEKLDGDVLQRNVSAHRISDNRNLNDDIEVVSHYDGSKNVGNVDTSEWAASASLLYEASDNVSYFGNISRGYFFPQIRSVSFNSLGQPGPYDPEIINTAELGIKFNNDRVKGQAAFFYTDLKDRQSISFQNDGMGGVDNVINQTSSEAFGIEVDGQMKLTEYLDLTGNITLRQTEFTKFDGNPQFIGNELARQPDFLLNAGLMYHNEGFDMALLANFTGNNFANDGNSVALGSYELYRLETGYTFRLKNNNSLRLGLSVFNLTDEQGITEGSPRLGNTQSGGDQYFVGRPILPRRITLRATYDF